MSNVDSGPLATYNSLMDRHLAGYFCNQRRRKHLVRSGLITRRGEVVSENTYRLNMARKEHKKHVKDLLAQAIVHKALDWERGRQVKIKQKLEEIAKIELVRRTKAECSRTGDEEVLPYLTPRGSTVDGSHQSRDRTRAKSARTTRDSTRTERTSIMIDEDGCPICSREESQSSRSHSQSSKQNGGAGKRSKYPKGEMDSRNLYALDQFALYEYNLSRNNKHNEQSRTSTYLTPLITRPKSVSHQPAPPSRPKPDSARRPKSTAGDKKGYLHPSVPPMVHPEEVRSGAEVTFKYFGEHLKLAHEPIGDPRHHVLVEQQPFGGNTLTAFKKPIMPGDTFSFISTRHRGYPFSLTFYVNGVQNTRLSTCCEYKRKAGSKIGGEAGHFGLVSVTGGIGPCFKCAASGRTKGKKEEEEEEKEEEPVKDKKREDKPRKDEGIKVAVQDDDDDEDDDYDDDDFEDDDDKPRGRDDDDDDSGSPRGGRGSAASPGGGQRSDRSGRSPSRGAPSSGDREHKSPRSGRKSRDEARDSPVMRSSPSSPDTRPWSDQEYTIEVEQDNEKVLSPEPETPEPEAPRSVQQSDRDAESRSQSPRKSESPLSPRKSETTQQSDREPESPRKSDREPESPRKSDREPESPRKSESPHKSDLEAESEPESRPYSRATYTDTDTPRGVTSGSETQDEYPEESSVEAMVRDKRDIEITNLALTPKQMSELAAIIKGRENIVSIVLRNCGMDDNGCAQICDAVRHSPSPIKLVNLNANKQVTSNSVSSICKMLKEKKSIQVLLLHGNPLGDAGIRTLVDTLDDIFHDSARSSPHLQMARVVVQGVMDDLTAEDSDPGYDLRHLDIGDTKMTDQSVDHVTRLLMLESSISVLSLTGSTGFSANGWKTIFEALKSNKSLKKLSLDYTSLRDSLVENMCDCLYSHPAIECLDLEGNNLTDRAANALVVLAERNPHVKKMKLLPGNEMGDDALDDIQDALRKS